MAGMTKILLGKYCLCSPPFIDPICGDDLTELIFILWVDSCVEHGLSLTIIIVGTRGNYLSFFVEKQTKQQLLVTDVHYLHFTYVF